jgi:aminoglycoside phosphotransferase (APT) family kinase protein
VVMHDDEVAIGDETVRALVDAQFPRWRDLPLRRVASAGTVNAIFRLGAELAVRLPLRAADPGETLALLEREAAASAELARYSPVPVPRPVAIGTPASGYPLPWSVQTWVPGTVASREDPGESASFAEDLAAFIVALRAVGTCGRRFAGTGRGGDLRAHDEWMETCLHRSEGLLDVPRLRRLWRELRDLPRDGADVMSHGDLIPGNVLVRGGRLAGVLDTGGFGPADPALELVAAWHLLGDRTRAVLRDRLGSGALEWERGKAWALEQAMGAAWYYADTNPDMSAMAQRTLARLLRAS